MFLLESGHVTVCKLSCACDIGMISLFWQAVEMALGMILTYASYCSPSIGQELGCSVLELGQFSLLVQLNNLVQLSVDGTSED